MNEHTTLVVLATGYLGRRILRLATEHAAFDPARRRVVEAGDSSCPRSSAIDRCRRSSSVVALMLDANGEICETLDSRRANNEAWIEDAFLRAARSTDVRRGLTTGAMARD